MKLLLTISIVLLSCTQPQQKDCKQELDSLKKTNTLLQIRLDNCEQQKGEFMYANQKRFEEVMDSLYNNMYNAKIKLVEKNRK